MRYAWEKDPKLLFEIEKIIYESQMRLASIGYVIAAVAVVETNSVEGAVINTLDQTAPLASDIYKLDVLKDFIQDLREEYRNEYKNWR